jgi:hypothetical protein
MKTIEQLEQNQRDIIAVLEWLIPATAKQPTDRIAFAMQRLLEQSISPESRAAAEQEQQRLKEMAERKERLKQPATWVPPPPAPPDSVIRAKELELAKRPSRMPGQYTMTDGERRAEQLEKAKQGSGM